MTMTDSPRRLGKIYKRRGVLRCAATCIDEISSLSSKDKRVAVACSEFKTEAYPLLLPHRITTTILLSFLDTAEADQIENNIKKLIKKCDHQCTLELISDRPPMKKNRKSGGLLRSLTETALEWEIPLEHESSLFPSVAGYVPSSIAVVCGLGPVARDIDTPQEAVLRLSLMQRTLLLAQFLARQAMKNKK